AACSPWAAPPVAAHAAHSPRIVRVGRNPPPEATNSHDSRPPAGVGAGCGARYAGRVTSASASGSAASESAASSSAASESAGHGDASYAAAGVDTAAGDRAVELMKASVARTHGPEVLGGVGGFAGLFDASALTGCRRPLLATTTGGGGTKIALALAVDKHDTIGQDLVAMVVDDIVVVGAKPLFMTDYIATGKVHPERIATLVAGVARACEATGTALV